MEQKTNRRLYLAMDTESTESTVQGVSTKDHEIGLKYRESGSLIEKGCTTDSVISLAIQYAKGYPTTRYACAIARASLLIPKKCVKGKNKRRGSKRPHAGRTLGYPS